MCVYVFFFWGGAYRSYSMLSKTKNWLCIWKKNHRKSLMFFQWNALTVFDEIHGWNTPFRMGKTPASSWQKRAKFMEDFLNESPTPPTIHKKNITYIYICNRCICFLILRVITYIYKYLFIHIIHIIHIIILDSSSVPFLTSKYCSNVV